MTVLSPCEKFNHPQQNYFYLQISHQNWKVLSQGQADFFFYYQPSKLSLLINMICAHGKNICGHIQIDRDLNSIMVFLTNHTYIKAGIDLEACNWCICKPGLYQKFSSNEQLFSTVISPSQSFKYRHKLPKLLCCY